MERVDITIGSLIFDHADFDAESDVLYLHVGAPRPAEGRRRQRDTSFAMRLGLAASLG
jgi:hypothetical protein